MFLSFLIKAYELQWLNTVKWLNLSDKHLEQVYCSTFYVTLGFIPLIYFLIIINNILIFGLILISVTLVVAMIVITASR